MPGRIKYKPSEVTRTIRNAQRRLAIRMADDSPTEATGGPILSPENNSASLELDKASIIWLVILSLIVVGSFIVISWLLCRCRRRKTKRRHSNGRIHHPSLEITDGRNQFQAWNRQVQLPPVFLNNQAGVRLVPLSHARRAEDVHPGEPVIVEEVPLSPGGSVKRNGRYFSDVHSVAKRASQIGKAY